MAPDLVLDPTELRAIARAADALLPVLQPSRLAVSDLAALAARPGGGVVVAEHDRLLGALGRAEAELAELVAGLRAVAVAAESAEHGFLWSGDGGAPMTSSDGAELQRARLWSASLAERVNGVVADVEGIVRRVAASWRDPRGDAWRDRLHALSGSLERDAEAAAELGRTIDRLVGPQSTPSFGRSRSERLGPRLGDVEARRVDDERGVDIPWLGTDPRPG